MAGHWSALAAAAGIVLARLEPLGGIFDVDVGDEGDVVDGSVQDHVDARLASRVVDLHCFAFPDVASVGPYNLLRIVAVGGDAVSGRRVDTSRVEATVLVGMGRVLPLPLINRVTAVLFVSAMRITLSAGNTRGS